MLLANIRAHLASLLTLNQVASFYGPSGKVVVVCTCRPGFVSLKLDKDNADNLIITVDRSKIVKVYFVEAE